MPRFFDTKPTVVPGYTFTYIANIFSFTPAATATDIFAVTPGTKVVRIHKISFGCTATAASYLSNGMLVYRRPTPNTGGTTTAVASNPMDSTAPASTTTVVAYTANPTITTAGQVLLFSFMPRWQAVNAATQPTQRQDDYIFSGPTREEGIVVRPGQQFVISNNGVAIPAGGIITPITVIWTEE
jgi:hypothetical protein